MIILEDFYKQNSYYQLDISTKSIVNYLDVVKDKNNIGGFYSQEKCNYFFNKITLDVGYFNQYDERYLYINGEIIKMQDKKLVISKERAFIFFTRYLVKTTDNTYICNLTPNIKLDGFENNIFDVIYEFYLENRRG